jgi:hypothetical protein
VTGSATGQFSDSIQAGGQAGDGVADGMKAGDGADGASDRVVLVDMAAGRAKVEGTSFPPETSSAGFMERAWSRRRQESHIGAPVMSRIRYSYNHVAVAPCMVSASCARRRRVPGARI